MPSVLRVLHFMTNNHLYTLGYEGFDVAAFIARLKEIGVKAIVDVRELPLSRKKGFSKTALRESLAQAGIAYFHVPALGCPKDIRDRYRADRDWNSYTHDFLAYLQTQGASSRELSKLAKATTACLICFEADHEGCHRTYVARAAHRLGAPSVVHLTARTAVADQRLRVAA
jgi:uncharacterized protein (DUF488 family)